MGGVTVPALMKTDLSAEVVWLGRVCDRDAALASDPETSVTLTFAGPLGEAHGGLTRPSCSRVLDVYPRDTPIRNVRQLSILSIEDLDAIAAAMNLDRVDPAWLGASMVLRGLPDFSHIPPGSRLRAPDGCTVTVDMQNRPCNLPAKVIEDARPGFGRAFKAAAKNRRGVTAWVEREGQINTGDELRLFIPDQRPWAALSEVRNNG